MRNLHRFSRSISYAAIVLLLAGIPSGSLPAETDAVIDFQSLEIVDAVTHYWGFVYEEDGFRLTNVGGAFEFATFGTLESRYPDSTALFNNTGNGLTQLTHVTGGTFDLQSIDISNLNDNGPVTVNFRGELANGDVVNASFTTSGVANSLETFVFPVSFRNLVLVEWLQEFPYHQFDNIRASTVDTIIDFQSLEIVDDAVHNWGYYYEEDGFTLTDIGANEFSTFGTLERRYPGSTALFNNTVDGTIVLENATGKPFDLLSIDISNLNEGGPVTVEFTGTVHCGGGTVNASYTTSGSENQLETFVLPDTFRNLDRVEWTQDAPFHQFDNIRVFQTDTIVDFQSLEVVGTGASFWGYFYEEDGYQLTNFGANEFATLHTLHERYAGSTALFNNTVDGLTVLTSENGGPFNLISIDIANLNNNGPVTVNFVGSLAGGGTVNASYTTTGSMNELETFFLPDTFRNLVSVDWLQEFPYHQFDNIRLSQSDDYIDFQSLEINDGDIHAWGDVYEEDGFSIFNVSGGAFELSTFGTQDARYPGSTALFNRNVGGTTLLENTLGEPFDLTSMDIANLNNIGPVTVEFTGFLADGGTVTASYTTTGSINELETFVFPNSFKKLAFVQWDQESPFHQFDNIRATLAGTLVPASSYTQFRGVYVSGDLGSTAESDDEYLIYNPGFTINSSEAPVWLIFDGNLSVCDSLQLTAESQAGTPGLTATLEAWNWNTSSYDVVDISPTQFNTDEVVTVDLTGAIENYVASGTMAVRTRIGWRKTGFTINYPWVIRLDQIGWIVN